MDFKNMSISFLIILFSVSCLSIYGMDKIIKRDEEGEPRLTQDFVITFLSVTDVLKKQQQEIFRLKNYVTTILLRDVQSNCFLEHIKEHVKAGANIHCKSAQGDSLLSVYVKKNCDEFFFRTDVLQYLIDQGVDPYLQNNDGDTLFHIAALNKRMGEIYSLKKGDKSSERVSIIMLAARKYRKKYKNCDVFEEVPNPIIKMILERLLGVPIVEGKNPFSIVTNRAYYEIKNKKGETVRDILERNNK